jgi:hypothetical protein
MTIARLTLCLLSITTLTDPTSAFADERQLPLNQAGPSEVTIERTISRLLPSGAMEERVDRRSVQTDGRGNTRSDIGPFTMLWLNGASSPLILNHTNQTYRQSGDGRSKTPNSGTAGLSIEWDAPPQALEVVEDKDLGSKKLDGVEVSGKIKTIRFAHASSPSTFIHSVETWIDDKNRQILSVIYNEYTGQTIRTKYSYADLPSISPDEFVIPPGYTGRP